MTSPDSNTPSQVAIHKLLDRLGKRFPAVNAGGNRYELRETDPAVIAEALAESGLVIAFDWTAWQESAERYVDDPKLLARADLDTLCKLVTVHVRRDRFCDGHLEEMIDSGHIEAILSALARLDRTRVRPLFPGDPDFDMASRERTGWAVEEVEPGAGSDSRTTHTPGRDSSRPQLQGSQTMDERIYVDLAREYLLTFDGVTPEHLETQLNDYQCRKPADMHALFRAFLMHAQNRQGMPNSIGDIDKLAPMLFDFDPREVLNTYQSWEEIFEAIDSHEYQPPGRWDKTASRSYWVIYCKSILSIARFLSEFDAVDDFDRFVNGFLTNPYSRLALPLLLEKEIFGFGFALACDMLKENGFPQFVKPDTHLNDIARAFGISDGDSDYEVFKDVEAYCRRIDELPYRVDKLFWLVGSGKFYRFDRELNTSKAEFFELARRRDVEVRITAIQ